MESFPRRGQIIIVDFGQKVTGIEMTKLRPSVVVQNDSIRRGQLLTVVPLSKTPPENDEPYVHKMTHHSFVNWPAAWGAQGDDRWAKCDYVATVSLDRCSLPYQKAAYRKRNYRVIMACKPDMESIDGCILWALGIKRPHEA